MSAASIPNTANNSKKKGSVTKFKSNIAKTRIEEAIPNNRNNSILTMLYFIPQFNFIFFFTKKSILLEEIIPKKTIAGKETTPNETK